MSARPGMVYLRDKSAGKNTSMEMTTQSGSKTMSSGKRDAYLRSMCFQNPEFIPCDLGFYPAAAFKYREIIPEFRKRHPWIHDPGRMEIPERLRAGKEYIDEWGCRWRTIEEGLDGQVIGHPLKNWSALKDFTPPPISIDRMQVARDFTATKEAGTMFAAGSGSNFFERLRYLRGYSDLLMDMASGALEPLLLINILLKHKLQEVQVFLEAGADVIFFYDDLGNQDRLMMSPALFRRYLKPAYAEIFGLAVQYNRLNLLHSDGVINEILPDLIECDVHSINLQGDIIGLDYLAEEWKGKVHLSYNLDMQNVLPTGTTNEIYEYIERIVKKLWLPQGGLSLSSSIMPDVPWKNVEALADSLERWSFYRK